MKKITAIIILVLTCAMLFACNGQSTTPGTQGTQGTSASTQGGVTPSAPTRPSVYLEKPQGLAEKVYFNFSPTGLTVEKYYSDPIGNVIEEHLYGINDSFGILLPTLKAVNTLDENGRLVSSVGTVLIHPSNGGLREKTLTVKKSTLAGFDYETVDEYSVVSLFLKEELNLQGKVCKTEYFSRIGTLMRYEVTEYHKNGERSKFTAYNADGSADYVCTYNENGNFVSMEDTLENGAKTLAEAEYYENGSIKSYTTVNVSAKGTESGKETVTFYENGNVKKYKYTTVTYKNDLPETIKTNYLTINLAPDGYVTDTYNSASKGTTLYVYDEQGRLTLRKTANTAQLLGSEAFKYNSDGSYTVEILGLNSVKSGVLQYSKKGELIREETWKSGKLSSYNLYEYDEFGALTRALHYDGNDRTGEKTYKYNADGRVTEEKSTGVFGLLHNKYEYNENGTLKKQSELQNGLVAKTVEYLEEGSYCVTEYNLNGTSDYTYIAITYDANERVLRRESDPNGRKQGIIYSYFENGNVKSVSTYEGRFGTGGVYYNEDGTVKSLYHFNEQGFPVETTYIRENGKPVRLEITTASKLTAYTLIEYFEYKDDNDNKPKSFYTYTADDVLISLEEYELITFGQTEALKETVSRLVRSEIYENGAIVAYAYFEYSTVHGEVLKSKVLEGTKYFETEYSDEAHRAGVIIYEKRYENGALTSIFEEDINEGYDYEETFFDANGVKTHKKHYYATRVEGVLNLTVGQTTTYEYYESGELYKEASYNGTRLEVVIEYRKNGSKIYSESYSYDTTGGVIRTYNTTYDENDNILRITDTGRSLKRIYDYKYEFRADGSVASYVMTVTLNGVFESSEELRFDEEGRCIYEKEIGENGGYTENTKEYGENGKCLRNETYSYNAKGEFVSFEIYAYNENDELLLHHTKYASGAEFKTEFTYDEEDRVIEYKETVNGKVDRHEKKTYYENGTMSSFLIYTDGRLSNAVYYNENGVRIRLFHIGITEDETYDDYYDESGKLIKSVEKKENGYEKITEYGEFSKSKVEIYMNDGAGERYLASLELFLKMGGRKRFENYLLGKDGKPYLANLEEYNETGVIILNVRSDGTNETKRVYTRGENSVLLKEEVFVNGVLTETTEYDYKTNGLIEKIQTKYDSEGRVSEIIEYNKKDNSAVHSRETFEYHENGKVKVHSVYGSDGKLKEKTEYDENGNVI